MMQIENSRLLGTIEQNSGSRSDKDLFSYLYAKVSRSNTISTGELVDGFLRENKFRLFSNDLNCSLQKELSKVKKPSLLTRSSSNRIRALSFDQRQRYEDTLLAIQDLIVSISVFTRNNKSLVSSVVKLMNELPLNEKSKLIRNLSEVSQKDR